MSNDHNSFRVLNLPLTAHILLSVLLTHATCTILFIVVFFATQVVLISMYEKFPLHLISNTVV